MLWSKPGFWPWTETWTKPNNNVKTTINKRGIFLKHKFRTVDVTKTVLSKIPELLTRENPLYMYDDSDDCIVGWNQDLDIPVSYKDNSYEPTRNGQLSENLGG